VVFFTLVFCDDVNGVPNEIFVTRLHFCDMFALLWMTELLWTMEDRVLQEGSSWVGRRLTVKAFRTHFGVYPRTVAWIAALTNVDVLLLLKSTWWLKEYPTDEHLKDYHVSPYNFRRNLWKTLETLRTKLPEVRVRTVLLRVLTCGSCHSIYATYSMAPTSHLLICAAASSIQPCENAQAKDGSRGL